MDKILEEPCKCQKDGVHAIAKKAVQCQNCHELSDCTSDLMSSPCHGMCPQKALVAKSPYSGLPCDHSAASSPGTIPVQSGKSCDEMLAKADAELEKLCLLKQLEEERLQLQQLLQKKSGEVGDWAAVCLSCDW